jgi:predicted MFS family arabinose efflux permease
VTLHNPNIEVCKTMTEVRDDRDPLSLVAGATAAQLIGGLVAQMSPFVVNGLMDGLALSERDAGLVLTVEFLALAIAALAIAPALPRLSARHVALTAATLTLLAQGASIFAVDWASLLLMRGIAGVGEGVLWAVSLSVIAVRSTNADKIYGYFQIAWAVVSIVLFSIAGSVTAAFAHRGILALIAGVVLLLVPLLFLVPRGCTDIKQTVAAAAGEASPFLGVLTLAVVGLFLTAGAAVYSFSAPMGERAGLDTYAIGHAFTVGHLFGLAGAVLATWLNVRAGRALPITVSCLAFAAVVLMLCLWREPTAFVSALLSSIMLYYFSTPYLLGLAAALDHTGRWAAAAGSAYLFGFAAGPLLAGATIAARGYSGLAAVCVALMVPVLGLALFVDRRLRSSRRANFPGRCTTAAERVGA